MKMNCAKSCGFCKDDEAEEPINEDPSGSQKCVDESKNCRLIKNNCKNVALYNFMKRVCAKTCGLCSGVE